MQSRRTFLKASVAALIGSLAPFRSQADPVALAVVKNGFVDTHEVKGDVFDSYAVEKGVLQFGKQTSDEGTCALTDACLFRGLSFTVAMHRQNPVPEVQGLFTDVIGPADHLKNAIDVLGDVKNVQKVFMRLGFIKEDNTSLWIDLPKVLFTSIGCSAFCFPESEDETRKTREELDKEVVKKFEGAIALDYVVPFRIIDPLKASYETNVQSMLSRRHRNPLMATSMLNFMSWSQPVIATSKPQGTPLK